jgi:chemotaxis response regulator CheB
MCRALTVLCVGADHQRLAELKRASVSAHWELAGGAVGLDQMIEQIDELEPDVVVLDRSLGPDAEEATRSALRSGRIVVAGPGDDVRAAVLGLPPVGGPVRT